MFEIIIARKTQWNNIGIPIPTSMFAFDKWIN